MENRSDTQTLLKNREPDNGCERIIEEEVNKTSRNNKKKKPNRNITDEMVTKAIAKLKNKIDRLGFDRFGWGAEW